MANPNRSGGNKRYRMTEEEFEIIREARNARALADRRNNSAKGGERTKDLMGYGDGLTPHERQRMRRNGELPPAPHDGVEQLRQNNAKAIGVTAIANEFRRREVSDGVTDIIAGDLRPDTITDVTSAKTGEFSVGNRIIINGRVR